MRSTSVGTLPNLVIIGAQKCGTTSLHKYLDLHPEIAMTETKETNFFLDDAVWDRGPEWYASQFDADAPVRGESSPDYAALPLSRAVPGRMNAIIPGARLIYLVRDPIERIISQYVHMVAAGLESEPIDDAVAPDPGNQYLSKSLYAAQLKAFLDLYPRDQVLVLTQQGLRENRAAALREIFVFLGISTEFYSRGFEREWERTEGKGRAYMAAWRMAQRGFRVPQAVRWPVQRMLRSPVAGAQIQRPEIGGELRRQLEEIIEPDVRELEQISGLDLTSWQA